MLAVRSSLADREAGRRGEFLIRLERRPQFYRFLWSQPLQPPNPNREEREASTKVLKHWPKAAAAIALTVIMFGMALAVPASAHPTPEPICGGERYAVIAAEGDAAMAELIASWQVLDTKCVISGAEQEVARMGGKDLVVILGGPKAIPVKVETWLSAMSIAHERIYGPDRLMTAEAVVAWARAWVDSPVRDNDGEPVDADNDETRLLFRRILALEVRPESEPTKYDWDLFGPHGSSMCRDIAFGAWTGRSFAEAGQPCHVDHIVALREAWQSGAHRWSAAKLRRFGSDASNHLPSLGCVNSSKGYKDAAEWPYQGLLALRETSSSPCRGMGVDQDAACLFVDVSAAVKNAYGLSVDEAERDAMLKVAKACVAGYYVEAQDPDWPL